MHRSRRHHHTPPRSEAQRAAVRQLDLQPAVHHENTLRHPWRVQRCRSHRRRGRDCHPGLLP
jgi:hypothetical protein